jgi:hypothetical protein
MTTILSSQNGKFKAVIRNAKGRYLRSKTFTRKTDAPTWARRIEADGIDKLSACDEENPACDNRVTALFHSANALVLRFR